MLEIVRNIFRIEDLRDRIIFTVLMLLVFRIGAHIPTPGIDGTALTAFFEAQQGYVYQQAPYEDIDAEKYDEMVASMPQGVDWNDLEKYEEEDNTTGSQELACVGGACEIV